MRTPMDLNELIKKLDDGVKEDRVVIGAMREVDAFLSDPIDFGTYDDADPISLEEFCTGDVMADTYIQLLSS